MVGVWGEADVVAEFISSKLGESDGWIEMGDSMWGTKRWVAGVGAMRAFASAAYCLSLSKRLCLIPFARPFLVVAIVAINGMGT